MAPFFFEEEFFVILSALVSSIPSMLLGIAMYVMTAIAFYTVAQRRGIGSPWMAWVPVLRSWIIGSVSDQYQYVVKGQVRSRRKLLLILNILSMVLSCVVGVLLAVLVAGVLLAGPDEDIMGISLALLGLCVPMAGIAIAATVVRYMALYDVYRSMDPGNSVLFLVLSIVFNVTEAFFLFFNRNKEAGMPPRKQPQPVCIEDAEPVPEAWTQENLRYE